MSSQLRIIVSALMATYPVGGSTWENFPFLLGLMRLGHDVYYFEDSGQWPYNPMEAGGGQDCAYNVCYLAEVMARFGLEQRWAYRFPGGVLPSGKALEAEWFGLPEARRAEILRSADLVINVAGGLSHPEDYRQVRRLAFVDTDPVFAQVRLARGEADFRRLVGAHDVLFTYGECLCDAVAPAPYRWRPTRHPVVLSEWRSSTAYRKVLTTVMNWVSYSPLEYEGRTYGHKDLELAKFLELPRLVAPSVLELAISAGEARHISKAFLSDAGWQVRDAAEVSVSLDAYRDYVESSMGEWSVAKNGYVVGRCGWFSGRSACYMAAGRPVVVQDTGFSSVLPVGEGVLAFQTLEEAAAAIREVEGNYAKHAKAARQFAEEYFDSAKVLSRLTDEAMN